MFVAAKLRQEGFGFGVGGVLAVRYIFHSYASAGEVLKYLLYNFILERKRMFSLFLFIKVYSREFLT